MTRSYRIAFYHDFFFNVKMLEIKYQSDVVPAQRELRQNGNLLSDFYNDKYPTAITRNLLELCVNFACSQCH